MSFLRPTGAALARQLCNTRARSECASRSPILALVHSYRASRPQCRAFSHSLRISARVVDTPQNPSIPQSPKRTVRIGPLPKGPVDDDTIRRIFGKRLSAHEGNNVLRILHHRRTAGSLADYGVDNLGKQYTHVSRETALKGLEWLRQKYPIDEARAAEEWAEKEANRISYELWLADPETESKYKDPARAFKEQMEKEEQERLQQESEDHKIGILHVGKSQFERNIEEKRKARLEEATRAAEEKEQNERDMEAKLASGEWVRTPTGKQLMKPGQTTYVDLFGKEQVSRRKEEMEKYTKASQTTDAETPEQLLAKTTVVQRLVPMTVFVFFIVAASWAFAHFYAPPSPEYRVIPDLSIALSTIGAIFAMNVVVSIAFRFMPLWPIMTRYFMHAPAYPYAVSSITNVFAHVQYEHLLGNMMMLGLVGYVCCDYVGRGVFMGTYISGGAMGTLFSLYWANLGRGSIFAHSVGASAAIWAVATLYCLITDQERLKIPIVHTNSEGVTFWPKMLLGAFIAFEMFTAARGKAQWADHASHFGGMFVGASVAGYLRWTGSLEKNNGALVAESAQANAGIGSETVDVGAMAKQEIKEVKDSLGKSSN